MISKWKQPYEGNLYRFGFLFPTYEIFREKVGVFLYNPLDNLETLYRRIYKFYKNYIYRFSQIEEILQFTAQKVDTILFKYIEFLKFEDPSFLSKFSNTQTTNSYDTNNSQSHNIAGFLTNKQEVITTSKETQLSFLSKREERFTEFNKEFFTFKQLFMDETYPVEEDFGQGDVV